MVKAYKFFYFLHDGKMTDGLFLTEAEGYEFIDNYECELFKVDSIYITKEYADLLA